MRGYVFLTLCDSYNSGRVAQASDIQFLVLNGDRENVPVVKAVRSSIREIR